MTPARIIQELNMQPHPEGGYFAETFRDAEGPEDRGYSTLIYYLLEKGQKSHWHRVDAVESWHYYAGTPLELSITDGEAPVSTVILGSNLLTGQRPQVIVPRNHWQSAQPMGAWTLVGCSVAPGFLFSGFEMAANDWTPPQ
ncbi:cupin domain-containing protein [Flexibacterium corallicola]|uniref:cupin domain-containing protein n=1 Tax=Flexibacterium corallicola TaxID=3037259 RepID=UPI00286F6BFC|nr:cupin domain-containing protein [Pseudovibrio sp. M1P-2-3]